MSGLLSLSLNVKVTDFRDLFSEKLPQLPLPFRRRENEMYIALSLDHAITNLPCPRLVRVWGWNVISEKIRCCFKSKRSFNYIDIILYYNLFSSAAFHLSTIEITYTGVYVIHIAYLFK